MKADRPVQYAIGVDLGGTKIELGIVDDAGCMHQQKHLDTLVQNGPEAIQEQIIEGIRALQQGSKVPIMGVGIGAAGQIHPQTGEVIFSPNLRWRHVPLQSNVKNALNIPVKIMNDVRAIAWGEWLYGAGKGCEDLLCVFIGTGIGGGVVCGGRLLTGCSNSFGEIGHMTIDLNGPICTCGKPGCLEVYASGWGIAARVKEAIEAAPQATDSQSLLELADRDTKNLTTKIVMKASHRGNKMAQAVIERAERALTVGMASLVNVFNPRRVILGGGLIEGIPELVGAIERGVRLMALESASQGLEMVKAKLGNKAGVVGSASAIFNFIGPLHMN